MNHFDLWPNISSNVVEICSQVCFLFYFLLTIKQIHRKQLKTSFKVKQMVDYMLYTCIYYICVCVCIKYINKGVFNSLLRLIFTEIKPRSWSTGSDAACFLQSIKTRFLPHSCSSCDMQLVWLSSARRPDCSNTNTLLQLEPPSVTFTVSSVSEAPDWTNQMQSFT